MPITGVAMMMLYEEGKRTPSDPLSRHIPEFKDLKVFSAVGADGQPRLEAPKHAPTMGWPRRHLGSGSTPPTTWCFSASSNAAAAPPGAPNIEDLLRQLTFQALIDPGK